jgi:dihydroorotase
VTDVLIVKNGHVVDPASGTDTRLDILIVDGIIHSIVPPGVLQASMAGFVKHAKTIDATGMVTVPAFVDMHVHFREPGTEGETIESGVNAAVAGGYGTVCVMPNTNPAIDTGERVLWQKERAEKVGKARVKVIGALTKGRGGKTPADLCDMVNAGAVGFSDDGSGVQDASVMLGAMRLARDVDTLVSDHAEDSCLAGLGIVDESVADKLGVAGKPRVSEEAMIARDIELARSAGCRYHVAHISTERSAKIVQNAKNDGLMVTAEVTPHHLALAAFNVFTPDCRPAGEHVPGVDFKMNPPLRRNQDVFALMKAISDGTIDAIATDHAPHPRSKKNAGLLEAPNGVTGLETAFSVAHTLLCDGYRMDFSRLIEVMSVSPRRILGIQGGDILVGNRADMTIIDLEKRWVVDRLSFKSQSDNSPFVGQSLAGKVMLTIVDGKVVFDGRDRVL